MRNSWAESMEVAWGNALQRVGPPWLGSVDAAARESWVLAAVGDVVAAAEDVVAAVVVTAVGLGSVGFEVRKWACHWLEEDLFALPHCG